MAQLTAERDEFLDLAQRARAELENFRKRASGELAAAELRGKEAIAREVLPALDNLSRALGSAGIDPGIEAGDDGAAAELSQEVSAIEAFAQGVALVLRELRTALSRAGVAELDPTGERFDPNRHEAIATRPGEGAEAGTVIETMQLGYVIGERTIRPARVIVAE